MKIASDLALRRRCATLLTLIAILLFADEALSDSRIAVLDPGHARILDALGVADRLVLMPHDPALDDMPSDIKRYRRLPSAEGLLALTPDLLIGGNPQRDRELLQQAKQLGIETVMLERTLHPEKRVHGLADLVERPSQGDALIARIEAGHACAARLIEGEPTVRVLHLSSSGGGAAGAITGAGAETSADALIRRAGGRNVGAEAGLDRYQTLSAEGVMAMAPEAILVSRLELAALGGRHGIWQRVPGLAHTPAAHDERLIVLDHGAVKFDGATSGRATLSLAEALIAP